MDKDLVKTLITSSVGILTASLPLIINYIGKKGKDSARKNLLDESQTRISFINNYYDSLKKFLPESELVIWRTNLASELFDLKSKINESNEKHANTSTGIHTTFQKIFLTYKPLSFMGWIWAILFYIDLCIFIIVLLGSGLNAAGNFSGSAFYTNVFVKDGGMAALIIPLLLLLLFRWVALRNYKKHLLHPNVAANK